MDDELKRMANPAHEMVEKLEITNELLVGIGEALENNQTALVGILAVIDGDKKNKDEKQSVRDLLQQINKTVECFKLEHRSHRGWGKKVTMFTICLAVVALGVEVATKGDVATFSVAYHYLRGLWL